MARSRKRKAGWQHTLQNRAERLAARKGEYSDTLREMMEISKKYTKMEIEDKENNKLDDTIALSPSVVLEGEIVE